MAACRSTINRPSHRQLSHILTACAACCCLQNLVALNFNQEAREADMRYSLVRVRENAESIAFYGGEGSEIALLKNRLSAVVANYAGLLVASRNLDFFTSFYRFLIQLLPAAVVAPLYFRCVCVLALDGRARCLCGCDKESGSGHQAN